MIKNQLDEKEISKVIIEYENGTKVIVNPLSPGLMNIKYSNELIDDSWRPSRQLKRYTEFTIKGEGDSDLFDIKMTIPKPKENN